MADGARIVLVPGLARTTRMFAPMARALAARGFEPVLYDYPSRRLTAPQAVARFRDFVAELEQPEETVHFVGFSLGALMIRGALAPAPGPPPDRTQDRALGRIVMIGPPNRGVGHLRDRRARWSPLFFGPAVHDLHAGTAFIEALPEPDLPTGVIAGTRRFSVVNPSSWLRLLTGDREPGDGTVELASTRLDRPHDFTAVPVNHTFMARHPEVIRQTVHFLEQGAFARSARP